MPAPDVANPVAAHCQTCPNHARNTGKNGKGKACRDIKAISLLPVMGDQLRNVDTVGSPFLLQIPPGSFTEWAGYVAKLRSMQTHPLQVVTRISFQAGMAYPVLIFNFQRFLRPDEVPMLRHWQQADETIAILGMDNRREEAPQITHQSEQAATVAKTAPPTPEPPASDLLGPITDAPTSPPPRRGRPRKEAAPAPATAQAALPVSAADTGPVAALDDFAGLTGNGHGGPVQTASGAPAPAKDVATIMNALKGFA